MWTQGSFLIFAVLFYIFRVFFNTFGCWDLSLDSAGNGSKESSERNSNGSVFVGHFVARPHPILCAMTMTLFQCFILGDKRAVSSFQPDFVYDAYVASVWQDPQPTQPRDPPRALGNCSGFFWESGLLSHACFIQKGSSIQQKNRSSSQTIVTFPSQIDAHWGWKMISSLEMAQFQVSGM